MRILIDLHTLSAERRGRGSGRYVTELVRALHEYLPEHAIEVTESEPRGTYDVVHYPFFDFFSPTLPLRRPAPAVVTIHDVIPLQYPSFYLKGVRGFFIWKRQQWALARVSRILTDAQASVAPIAHYTGVPIEKITAIPLAVSSAFHAPISQKGLEEVQSKYRLPATFILYVGDANWNKNVKILLETASDLNIDVVLVGGIWCKTAGGHVEEAPLRDILARFGDAPWLHRVGQIPDSDLVGLYRSAAVLVQPSLAEGFSFPVLEAMTVGCPVVASDIAIHRELANDAVLYFNPGKKDMLIDTIRTVLDESLRVRGDLILRGKKRAAAFTWKRTVHQVAKVYRVAAHGK